MKRPRITQPCLFIGTLLALWVSFAVASCRRETPVPESRLEPARTPVAAPQSSQAPEPPPPIVRALAAIPATVAATPKRRAVSPIPPGSVRWSWQWYPDNDLDITGQTVTVSIWIDRESRYGSSFVATGKVSQQRYVIDLPRVVTDGHFVGAVLTSGSYESGASAPTRELP